MHMLEIRRNDNCKNIANFWIIWKINFALFQLSKNYKSQNIKLVYNINNIFSIKKNFYIWEILRKDQVIGGINHVLSVSTNKNHIRNFIKMIDDKNDQKQIKKLCINNIFSFIYNGIIDQNLNPAYNYKEFKKNYHIAIEFTIYAINFPSAKVTNRTFNYNF